jgi:predicted DNA-binding ribbon-helix-helix protein
MKPRRPLKRPIILDGRKTSFTLEDGFWNALKEIAAAQETSVQKRLDFSACAFVSRHHRSQSNSFGSDNLFKAILL